MGCHIVLNPGDDGTSETNTSHVTLTDTQLRAIATALGIQPAEADRMVSAGIRSILIYQRKK